MDKQIVFVVDDEISIQKLVSYHLSKSGYVTETAVDGQKALETIMSAPQRFDLVILDIMLPGMDGVEVCRRLREAQIKVPIILLTARDDEIDRVVGLEIGADDYVTKPFSPRELMARVRAVLRRIEVESSPLVQKEFGKQLFVGDIVLNSTRHEVVVRSETIDLTPKEFELLKYFLQNVENVLTRDQLLDHVWGYASIRDTRIVDVHVSHLREKIELNAKQPKYLRTVRGVGYRLTNKMEV
jgi:two-component system alkaline phosphatase synthesis response regulator PhoP